MSSTEKRQKQIRRFYDKKLSKVAQRLQQRDVRFFPLGADDAETWYVPGPVDEPEFVGVELDRAADDLRALWERQGLPELAGIAKDLVKLAREVELHEEQAGDLDPFMYVMY